jgi:methionyl-tRNA synthetase
VMWPSILLGVGDLDLPYDVVSSEFLTMEGRKFSSSRRVVIYVRDFLSRYDADALRYYLTVAGPETQDTDFTWAEFVRRNNDELVGTWGNLVHRTLVNAHRNFGGVPPAGDQTARDRELRDRVRDGFNKVGAHLEAARFKAALQEAMALAHAVNQYLGEQEPWQVIKSDRDRAGTVLNVAVQCVNDLRVLFTPFLPFSSQRLHELLGHEGVLAPQPETAELEEAGGRLHRVLRGDYDQSDRWYSTDLPAGRELPPPVALFKKLDEKVVEEELARLGGGD